MSFLDEIDLVILGQALFSCVFLAAIPNAGVRKTTFILYIIGFFLKAQVCNECVCLVYSIGNKAKSC